MRLHAWILAGSLALALAPGRAKADVVTDGSLGPAGVVPGGDLPDGSRVTYRIDESLGQRHGGNLFQSFSSFSLRPTESAAFTADLPTERVLARVTGGSSLIQGSLRSAIPGADLYLMNPAGVTFASGSSLDVKGSFYVSSARSLKLADGTRFEVSPVVGEVLSSAVPSAWGFTSVLSGGVTLRSCNCAVPLGETLSAVGGGVNVRSSNVLATAGRIELAATLSPGDVPLDLETFHPRGAPAGALGPVTLTSLATLDASDPSGDAGARGRIVIRGGKLAIGDISGSAGIANQSPSGAGAGDFDVDLEASESITVSTSSDIVASALGSGPGGAIRVSAPDIGISGSSIVETRTAQGGSAGDVDVDADVVHIDSAARLGSTSEVEGGPGGTIRIRSNALEVVGGAQVTGTTLGTGRAGNVDIQVGGDVLLSGEAPTGPSGVFSRSGLALGSTATGNGGDIAIHAAHLAVEDGAEISVQSYGTGASGSIRVEASDGVRVASLGASSASINSQASEGSGGDISIVTAGLEVANGGVISATTIGLGDAGDVVIEAPRVVVGGGEVGPAGGAGIFAQSLLEEHVGVGGAGGNIELRVPGSVEVLEGGSISVNTKGNGDAGTIRFLGTDQVVVRGGSIGAFTTGTGDGGLVSMQVGDLQMRGGTITTEALGLGIGGEIAIVAERDVTLGDGARIGATTDTTGNAGNVGIDAGRALSLQGGSRISTQTKLVGNGGEAGNITIHAGEGVQVAEGSSITSETSGAGAAGRIAIDGGKRVVIESGGQVSSATSFVDQAGDPPILAGDGGSIDVSAKSVHVRTGGTISAASSGSGDAGRVTISAGRIGVGDGASISSQTALDGLGGDIALSATREIEVSSGGQISASAAGAGDAGGISIDAGDQLIVRDGGRITTQADTAFGGNIEVRARELVHVRYGEITTSVNEGAGNGGNISIDPKFVVLDHGRIEARANAGNGGNITIATDHFLADGASSVDASSQLGIDGTIEITAPAVDLTGELAQLSSDYLDASSQLSKACASRSAGQGTFQVSGGAKQSAPDAPLGADAGADEAAASGCEPR